MVGTEPALHRPFVRLVRQPRDTRGGIAGHKGVFPDRGTGGAVL